MPDKKTMLMIFLGLGILSFFAEPAFAAPECKTRAPSDYEHIRTTTKDGYTFQELRNIRKWCSEFKDETSRVVVTAPDGRVIALLGQQETPTTGELVYSFRIEKGIPDKFPFVAASYSTGGNGCGRKYFYFTKNKPFRMFDSFCSYHKPTFVTSDDGVPGLLMTHEFQSSWSSSASRVQVPYVATDGRHGFVPDTKLTRFKYGPDPDSIYEKAEQIRITLNDYAASYSKENPGNKKILLNDFHSLDGLVGLPVSLALSGQPKLAHKALELSWSPKVERGIEWNELVKAIEKIQWEMADLSDGNIHDLDGLWKLKEFRTAGAYSGRAKQEAENLLGKEIMIHDTRLSMPGKIKCHLVNPEQITLKDDMETFGSAGGSWRQIGLSKAEDGTYRVVNIELECDQEFLGGIVIQPEQDLHLFEVMGVHLLMQKTH